MMKFIKHSANLVGTVTFEKRVEPDVEDKIIKHIRSNKEIYFITEQNRHLGFVHLTYFPHKISVKLYMKAQWDENLTRQFLRNLSKLIENYAQEFIVFSHIYDSANILHALEGIDYMDEFIREGQSNKSNIRLPSGIRTLDEIDNLHDLIDFHYLCYADDKEYMQSNWNGMLQSFAKASVQKITYICKSGNDTVGACIGYIMPKKNMKYL